MRIEEFVLKLDKFEKAYPADASDALEKGAKKMTRSLKKATPVGRTNHKHKLGKSWRVRMNNAFGKAPEALIRNRAPHYHLVERGVQSPKDAHGQPKPEWRAALNKHRGFTKKTVQNSWPDIKEAMARDFYKKVRDRLG